MLGNGLLFMGAGGMVGQLEMVGAWGAGVFPARGRRQNARSGKNRQGQPEKCSLKWGKQWQRQPENGWARLYGFGFGCAACVFAFAKQLGNFGQDKLT